MAGPVVVAGALLFTAAQPFAQSAPSEQAWPAEVSTSQLPPKGTAEISQHGGHLTWVQDSRVLDRFGGRTRVLPIAPPVDLDLGPGPGGATIAVYARCKRTCRLWRYDFRDRRESRLRTTAERRGSERMPSIWGRRIAFARGPRVLVGELGRRANRTVSRLSVLPDDVELGARHVAYAGYRDSSVGNGETVLRVRGLISDREQTLDEAPIGEATSAGRGGLAFRAGRLLWQERRRHGCRVFEPTFWAYHLRRGRVRKLAGRATPRSVRAVEVIPPPTPESDFCRAEG